MHAKPIQETTDSFKYGVYANRLSGARVWYCSEYCKFLLVILWFSKSTYYRARHKWNEHIQTNNEASNAMARKADSINSSYRQTIPPIFYLQLLTNVVQLRCIFFFYVKRDDVRSNIKSQISIYTIIWANPFPRFSSFFSILSRSHLTHSQLLFQKNKLNLFIMRMLLSLLASSYWCWLKLPNYPESFFLLFCGFS